MARFLTDEWLKEVVAACNASDDVKSALEGVQLTIQQIVTGADVSYWTKLNDGSVEAGLGASPDADVEMTLDHETAAEMNRGELNAQAAFMQGKLKITGNMGKLLQNQGAVSALGPVMAAVPTEY